MGELFEETGYGHLDIMNNPDESSQSSFSWKWSLFIQSWNSYKHLTVEVEGWP